MQKLQGSSWVISSQQSSHSRASHGTLPALFLWTRNRYLSTANNSRSRYCQPNSAVSLRLMASQPRAQNKCYMQLPFAPPMTSISPISHAYFSTKTALSKSASSTTVLDAEPSPISTEKFHRLSDAYIDTLVAKLEALQEDREEVDVEYSAGVLSLIFPPAGTYVLNKQPPNKQIWLSSPLSGPKRYDWVETDSNETAGNWIYLRDGSTLDGLLADEIGITTGDD